MKALMTIIYDWPRVVAGCLTWAGPRVARITVGAVVMDTGWTKLHHLAVVAKNFAMMGIPAPHIFAALVGGIEFLGGLLVLVGLFTRLTTVPLMIVMAVAVVVARLGEVRSLEDFLACEEVVYFVMFAWLAIAGPGPVSVDRYLLKTSGRDPATHGA